MNFSCLENCGNQAKYVCLYHNPNIYLCRDHSDKHLEDDHQIKPLFKRINDKGELNAYAVKLEEYKRKVLLFFSNVMKEIEDLNRVVYENLDRILKGIMIIYSKGIPRDFNMEEIEIINEMFEERNLSQWLLCNFRKEL